MFAPLDPDRIMWLAIRRGVLRIAANVESRGIARGLEEIADAIGDRWGIERKPPRRERKRQGSGGDKGQVLQPPL